MTTPAIPPMPPAVPDSIVPQQVEQIQQQEEVAQFDELRALAAEINKPEIPFNPTTIRKGAITAFASTASPPTVTLTISGDTTAIAGVRFIDSYTPIVGDTVLILKQGADIMVLGHIAEAGSTWTTASLNGHSQNGNGNGTVQYRRVFDHGSWKMQWRGGLTYGGSTSVLSSALATDYRPSGLRTVLAARSAGGAGANNVKLDFDTDGTITVVGATTGITDNAHTHSVNAVSHSHGGAVANTTIGGSTTGTSVTIAPLAPDWISFNGVEYFL